MPRTKLTPELAEDIARLQDISAFKRFVEHVETKSGEADHLSIFCNIPDDRAIYTGYARAWREFLDLVRTDPRRR